MSKAPEKEEKVYKARWIVLIVQCLLNITNNMIFVSYASVTNFVNDYYDRKDVSNIMSIVFLAVSVPTFVIALSIAERLGLRWMLIGSAFLNAAGAGIRILSTVDSIDLNSRFALSLIGQAITASANPATLFLNTKIPSLWFPSNQRTLATALTSISGPLGILIISPLSSAIVKSESDLMNLNIVVFIPAAATAVLSIIGVHRSAPATAPSKSANNQPLGTLLSLKRLVKNRDYLILLIGLASGLGIFNTYYTTMEQTVCGRGYDNGFAALCTALMIGGGLIGAIIGGMLVDRTKLFEEVFKIALCLANIFGLMFSEFVLHPNYDPFIAVSICIFGTFGIAYYAVGMDISAEITYPVPETLSAGLIGLVGQILGVVYVSLWNALCRPLPDQYANIQRCTISGETVDQDALVEQDTMVPMYLLAVIGTLIAMVSVMFFKPKYLRVLMEKGLQKEAPKESGEKKMVEKF